MGHDQGKYAVISMIINLSDIIVIIWYFLDFPLFQMSLFDPRFDDDWVPHKWRIKSNGIPSSGQYTRCIRSPNQMFACYTLEFDEYFIKSQ